MGTRFYSSILQLDSKARFYSPLSNAFRYLDPAIQNATSYSAHQIIDVAGAGAHVFLLDALSC